jgi:hypothetical protein
LLLVPALALAWLPLREAWRTAERLGQWQRTQGVVERCELRPHRSGCFGVRVEFRYEAEGQSLSARGLSPGPDGPDECVMGRWRAEELAQSLQPGAQVDVYYAPARPQQASLQRTPRLGMTLLLVLMLGAGGLLAWLGWGIARPQPAAPRADLAG